MFHVIEADDDPILGLSLSVSLGLVSFGNKVDVRQSSHLVSSLVPVVQTCPCTKEVVYQCYKDVFSDDKIGDFNIYHDVKWILVFTQLFMHREESRNLFDPL